MLHVLLQSHFVSIKSFVISPNFFLTWIFFFVVLCIIQLTIDQFLLGVDFTLQSLLSQWIEVELGIFIVEEAVLTADALINKTQVIGLHLVEEGVQNTFRWLIVVLLEWNIFSSIMNVIDELEKLDAP